MFISFDFFLHILLLYHLWFIFISVLVLVIQLRLIHIHAPYGKTYWDTITPTGTCMTLHFKYIYFNVDLVSPLHIAIIASNLLGRLSTRFWSASVGIFARSFSRAFVRSDLQSSFQFIPKVFDEVKGKALSGSVKFIHTKLIHTCLYTEAKHRSVIRHPTEHVSTAPESSGSMLYTTPSNAWHCTWWCKGYMQLKSIPWSSCCTFLDPITVPFLNSFTELFFDPFFPPQMFVNADCMARCLIL